MKSLLKLIVAVAVLAFLWKQVLPKLQSKTSASSSSSATVDDSCVAAAADAAETWGNGIGKFTNPGADMAAWNDFRSNVESRARSAEGKCLCAAESCTTAKAALNDLRSLANEMDQSLRSGSPPPSDLVQRQESIDNGINSARELVKQGK